jgi:hypothetical protein
LQENSVRFSSPNAFRAYVFTDGRQSFVPAASRNASLFLSLSFGPLFFKANGRSSALQKRAAIQR